MTYCCQAISRKSVRRRQKFGRSISLDGARRGELGEGRCAPIQIRTEEDMWCALHQNPTVLSNALMTLRQSSETCLRIWENPFPVRRRFIGSQRPTVGEESPLQLLISSIETLSAAHCFRLSSLATRIIGGIRLIRNTLLLALCGTRTESWLLRHHVTVARLERQVNRIQV